MGGKLSVLASPEHRLCTGRSQLQFGTLGTWHARPSPLRYLFTEGTADSKPSGHTAKIRIPQRDSGLDGRKVNNDLPPPAPSTSVVYLQAASPTIRKGVAPDYGRFSECQLHNISLLPLLEGIPVLEAVRLRKVTQRATCM